MAINYKITTYVFGATSALLGGVAAFLWLGSNGLAEEVATLEVENEDLKNQLTTLQDHYDYQEKEFDELYDELQDTHASYKKRIERLRGERDVAQMRLDMLAEDEEEEPNMELEEMRKRVSKEPFSVFRNNNVIEMKKEDDMRYNAEPQRAFQTYKRTLLAPIPEELSNTGTIKTFLDRYALVDEDVNYDFVVSHAEQTREIMDTLFNVYMYDLDRKGYDDNPRSDIMAQRYEYLSDHSKLFGPHCTLAEFIMYYMNKMVDDVEDLSILAVLTHILKGLGFYDVGSEDMELEEMSEDLENYAQDILPLLTSHEFYSGYNNHEGYGLFSVFYLTDFVGYTAFYQEYNAFIAQLLDSDITNDEE
jgi:hypothetical protein